MSEHRVTVSWERATEELAYESYSRSHSWAFESGLTVPASAARASRGDPERLDPDEAFVAALSSCHMLTFLAARGAQAAGDRRLPRPGGRVYRAERAGDPRDLATYTVAEAARLLRIPVATLRSWVLGRPYPTADGQGFSDRLIQPPPDPHDRLSFLNLIEAHVLCSLRTRHGLSTSDVRKALDFAQERFGVGRLLIHQQLKAAPGRLFFQEYSNLVELPKGGQLALREVFEAHLQRVAHDARDHLPARFYPWFPIEGQEAKTAVVIDARIAFGSPVTARRSIRTAVIADRFEAGETVQELARDYDLEHAEIEDAIRFERAA